MKQRLGALQNLHVSSLSLLNCLIVLVPGLGLAGEGLIYLGEAIGEDGEILLDLGLLLLLLKDVLVDLLALLAVDERSEGREMRSDERKMWCWCVVSIISLAVASLQPSPPSSASHVPCYVIF